MIKKYIYSLAIAALVVAFGSSCSRETKELFDKTPAQRTDEAKANYKRVLTDRGGKWEMEFWANGDISGFVALMTFNANGAVDIEMYHDLYADYVYGSIYHDGSEKVRRETSFWDVIGDDGPVVTLQSYNHVFHIFSDPYDLEWTEERETGKGFGSDYEFKLMGVSDDENVLTLRGKKSGRTMYLRRIDTSTEADKFFADLNAFKAQIFNAKIPQLYLNSTSGEEYIIKNFTAGLCDLYPNPGDEVTQTTTRNYIARINILKFMYPFKGFEDKAKFTVQEFNYIDGALVCNDSEYESTITAGPRSRLLTDDRCVWTIDKQSTNGSVADAIAALDEAFKKGTYKEYSKSMAFEYDKGEQSWALVIKVKKVSPKFYCDFVANGNDGIKVTFTHDDKTGGVVRNAFPEVTTLCNALSGECKLTSDTRINPVPMTINTADGSRYEVGL